MICPPGPCLEELENAFFGGKMDRFGAVEVMRWRRTIDGMKRLCSFFLAVSSSWIMLDSELCLKLRGGRVQLGREAVMRQARKSCDFKKPRDNFE